MRENDLVREGLVRFAEAVTVKTASVAQGAPEDQLRAPFEGFLKDLGAAWGWTVTCTGEATLPNRLGRPDYAVSRNKLLTGHVELKRPGTGASSSRFSGHDEEQFKRFSKPPERPLHRRQRMGALPSWQAGSQPGAPRWRSRRRWPAGRWVGGRYAP